jgi:hypothetical protein
VTPSLLSALETNLNRLSSLSKHADCTRKERHNRLLGIVNATWGGGGDCFFWDSNIERLD